jgi:hypothetical protein
MSVGVTEITQRLSQYTSLKFLCFALRDVDIIANSHLTRKVYLLRPSGLYVSFDVSVSDSQRVL